MSFWQNKVIEVSARQNIANLCERRKVAPRARDTIKLYLISLIIYFYYLYLLARICYWRIKYIYVNTYKCSNIYYVFGCDDIFVCVF